MLKTHRQLKRGDQGSPQYFLSRNNLSLLTFQGSACDVLMKYNGANVARFGNRNNNYPNSFRQMCQTLIQEMVTVKNSFNKVKRIPDIFFNMPLISDPGIHLPT